MLFKSTIIRLHHRSGRLLVCLILLTASSHGTPIATNEAKTPVHAIHLTAWAAGSLKYRRELDLLLDRTSINAVVIDVKEYEGEVYVPGVEGSLRAKTYVSAIPDLKNWIADLKRRGIYTVARVVVFKDNKFARVRPDLAVKDNQGNLWLDRHQITWLDPSNPESWRYNLLVALAASQAGFDEVQFDYVRFPTDGNLHQMRLAKTYSLQTSSEALIGFLKQAVQLLHPRGTKVSVDVFGLTTSVGTGMGIGQIFSAMAEPVDFICPMVYPSHYGPGFDDIKNPNNEPYKVVYGALRDARKALGSANAHKLRPYLQDFSLGVHYGQEQVKAQIRAAADLDIQDWTLWNARCRYTVAAIEKTDVIALSTAAPVVAK